MPASKLGAHEVLEIHEVLTDTIDGINQFQLYRPYVKDQQLAAILDNQLQFMEREYNEMLSVLQNKGQGHLFSYRTAWQSSAQNAQPNYGLRNPAPEAPNASMNELDDRDIASGMLGCSKASATLRMQAALECADPQIRQMMIQGATSCAEQAYETFQYMNQKGYYQVPTLQANTTSTMMNQYQPTQQQSMSNQQSSLNQSPQSINQQPMMGNQQQH